MVEIIYKVYIIVRILYYITTPNIIARKDFYLKSVTKIAKMSRKLMSLPRRVRVVSLAQKSKPILYQR